MYKPDSTRRPSGNAPMHQMQRDAVAEIIRRAEFSISGQEYASAQELLAEAWRLDPGNPYIPAIVERVQLAQAMQNDIRGQSNGESGRYLSVSVGNQFHGGIKPAAAPLTEDQQGRLRRLLTVAATLQERGAYDTAYDTILKAEEMNPDDPDVIALKARIRPMYQNSMTGRKGLDDNSLRRGELPGVAASMAVKLLTNDIASEPPPPPPPTESELRITALRKQKEQMRLLREQQMWREAGASATPPPAGETPRTTRPATRPPGGKSGLLSSLFKGKM